VLKLQNDSFSSVPPSICITLSFIEVFEFLRSLLYKAQVKTEEASAVSFLTYADFNCPEYLNFTKTYVLDSVSIC